jgi:hypothetical protein
MLTWDNDIKFLCKRIDDQKSHIEITMLDFLAKKIDLSRSLEIINSALRQYMYFETKVLHWTEATFPVGTKVQFINWEENNVEWVVKEIFLKDHQVTLNDGIKNCCLNIPANNVDKIFESIKKCCPE